MRCAAKTLSTLLLGISIAILCGACAPFSGALSILDAGPTDQVRAGGLTMIIHAPAGPYFVSELLPVDVALTNLTAHAVGLAGAAAPVFCSTALWVSLTV